MLEDIEQFMLESNRIEGEDRVNPNDVMAATYAEDIDVWKNSDILRVHKLLGEYLNEPWVGKYRDVDVTVGGYDCPSYMIVDDLMEKYIRALPKMDSWKAHNEFQMIHPFRDLNGRMGRLIWLSKAVNEGYNYGLPFLQKYYYQTLSQYRQ